MAELSNWVGAHEAYQAALAVEEQLLHDEVGEEARASVLREGRDAPLRDGYVLAQLGRADEALVAVEHGRARGLAEMFLLDAADPDRISDRNRRARFIEARERFTLARAALYADRRPITNLNKAAFEWFQPDRSSVREAEAERATAFQQARIALDTILDEIHREGDPENFVQVGLDATAILRRAEACGPRHALVYLAATPWGGFAVGAFATTPRTGASAHITTLNLPELTYDRLTEMTLTKVADGYQEMIGGFAHAQCATALRLMELPLWTRGVLGGSFRLRAQTIYEICTELRKPSTLSAAAQRMLGVPDLRQIVDRPFTGMDHGDRSVLDATTNHAFLDEELRSILPKLATMAMRPLAVWLNRHGATSVTLIPCGYLEAYPLAAARMTDGRTFAETFATSIAPSAQALRFEQPEVCERAGVYTFGDPANDAGSLPSLPWSEAEALAVAKLARLRGLTGLSFVQKRVTSSRLNTALARATVVDASCHGRFDPFDFLRSALLLADAEPLTLADLLSLPLRLRGVRLLILSACQTAIPDVRGQTDEVRSIAAAAIQAGVRAVLAALWPVDDRATFLLVVRFMQEWLPVMDREPPAFALARAQQWLRTATNRTLRAWQVSALAELGREDLEDTGAQAGYQPPWTPSDHTPAGAGAGARVQLRIRGGGTRYALSEAERRVHYFATSQAANEVPYADPIYWAGFQVVGW
jgi:CHAT domain-containing protein